jgi:O-antigen/teichoic acid export membrane protein
MLSGYGSIAVNILYTMVSVPLAIHFLDKESFGMWALAAQVNGYLNLIDLGMTAAVSRYIADHKDHVNGGKYGSHLLTGGITFALQGLVIAGVGIGLSWFAPMMFAIPGHLAADFRQLLMLLAGLTGISIGLRSLGSPLWAFQRNDIINYISTLGLLVNLAILWWGFTRGWGVFSFAYATIPASLGIPAVYAWFCHRKGYFPSRGCWGRPRISIFRRMFHYGKDALMVNMGAQMINATQIMIVSRWVNLEAAAAFAISTKIYAMGILLIANPVSVSGPGLIELYVRGERARFIQRFWDVIAMTLAASTIVAVGIACGNRFFVSVWTQGSIQWNWAGDLILAILVILRSTNGCFLNLFGLTKDWRPVRHILALEGLLFIPLAIFLANFYGLTGVLVASLTAHLLITTLLSARAAAKIVGSPVRILGNLSASLGMIFMVAAMGWIGTTLAAHPYTMLAITAMLVLLSLGVTWQWVLPEILRQEFLQRISAPWEKLRKIFGTCSR